MTVKSMSNRRQFDFNVESTSIRLPFLIGLVNITLIFMSRRRKNTKEANKNQMKLINSRRKEEGTKMKWQRNDVNIVQDLSVNTSYNWRHRDSRACWYRNKLGDLWYRYWTVLLLFSAVLFCNMSSIYRHHGTSVVRRTTFLTHARLSIASLQYYSQILTGLISTLF